MVGIDPRQLGKRRPGADRKLDAAQEIALTKRFIAGDPIPDLMADFELGRQTVYNIAYRNGAPRPTAKVKGSPSDHERANDLTQSKSEKGPGQAGPEGTSSVQI